MGFGKSRGKPFGRSPFAGWLAMGPHIGPASRQPQGNMVLNRPDRDIKPGRDFLLRQALHLAKDEHLGALGRQGRNRAREQANALSTINNILNRGLTAIF